VRLFLTEAEAEKIGRGVEWRRRLAELERRRRRQQSRFDALQASLDRLLEYAAAEELSRRKLAVKIGIPESSLRKIGSGRVNPSDWLPRLEAALAKLKLS
jgi:ribosome-binding protein aMBF1 (putative translation factor)